MFIGLVLIWTYLAVLYGMYERPYQNVPALPARFGQRPLAACFFRCAPGFGRRASRNSLTGKVLMTSFLVSQPLRAVVTPYRIKLKFAAVWESVEMTTFTPRSLHIRKYTSFKSRRSGYELHSIATPCFAQASRTFSMS